MAESHHQRQAPVLMEWPARIPVLRNRNLWFGFLIAFAIPSMLMGGVFAWIGTLEDGLMVGAGFLLFFLLIFVIVGGVMDLFGGFRAVFRLTEAGVESLGGQASTTVGRVATLGGTLAGSVGTVGAGIAARGESKVFIPWSEVRSVSVREQAHSILIKAGFGAKPIGLYCTPENFREVRRIVNEHVAGKVKI